MRRTRNQATRSAGIVIALAVSTLTHTAAARAQPVERRSDVNANSWFMYFGDHPIKKGPWGLHFDGQFRRQGIGQKWQQLLLRPGVNYDVNKNVQLSGGYAFIRSHPYGDFPGRFNVPEHRLWEQLILKQRVGKAGLAHRFRLEQRYIGIKDDPGGREQVLDYIRRNRVRYFIKGTIPIGGADGRYFVGAYNEVMFNFGKNLANNVFDQNRAYLAIGRKIRGLGAVEIGYLQQTVQQGNGRVFEFNHTLQVGLFSSRRLGRN